ncbi:hypothetical protein ScPMuIL_018163 [Solemya velum]
MDYRQQSMSTTTLVTVPGWVLVSLFVYVSQDMYTEAACPSENHPAVRMCEDSMDRGTYIFLDASSAEKVCATQCRCTILPHGDARVPLSIWTAPGYNGCETSLDVMSTEGTTRVNCERPTLDLRLNSGSIINITLNIPPVLSRSNVVDYCYYIDGVNNVSNMTVRCWSPYHTSISQDETSTPILLRHTSSGQDFKHTNTEEQFPVEIVVPVVVVAVVFCVATIVGSVIYVRRHTDSIRNPTYDRHAIAAAHDTHVYEDMRQTSDDL